MTETPIIQLHDVLKRYGNFTAVNGINLEVRAGEIFGILGPNGAGKTTTLEMIEGLRQPDSGSIRVAGFDAVRQVDEVRKIIGVQLQSTSLFPHLSAMELLELFGHFYGIADPKQRATELLAKVNLADKAGSRMEQLSGGQQQRLSIALALVNTPVVSFLDEPTTGLDPHARRNLWQTILDVRASGSTVVLTTHYMDEAEQLCDRIAIMDGGNVIACDTPQALIRSLPQDAVVKASSTDRIDWSNAQLASLPGATSAEITHTDLGSSVAIGTADVQATIVALLDLAAADNVRLNDLASTSASLEDVFLALTGRSYEDTDDAAVTEEGGMNSFLAMLVANIKMSLRNRQAMFWNLAFPALFIVLFGSIFNSDNMSRFDIGVIESDSPMHTAVVDALGSSDAFVIHEGTEADELAALENDDRVLVLSFPEQEGDPIRMYSADRPGDVTSQVAISATRSVLTEVLGASQGIPIEDVKIDTLNASFMDWFMPGIIAMSLMNTGIIGISTAFVSFRERGILRRIKVTPFPLWKFLTARVLGAMIVGLLSTFLLIGLAMLLFDASVRGNWALIIAMVILVSTCMLSLGAAVAAVARNVETAAGMANLVTFPMMFLSGVFFPVNAMPDWMRPIMSVMPLRYGVEALREPMLYGRGIDAIWMQILILTAISVVAIAFAVRFFKWDATAR